MQFKSAFPFIMTMLLITQYGCKDDCNKSSNCELEPDPGLCLAYFPKYYFDKEAGRCKEFIWGGCGGVVPFESLEACKECECND
ncbi:MAG: BPTI/Kunitz domain-containing protein [Cyclobacteriaceae bacterium]